jgi:hypothetical protein
VQPGCTKPVRCSKEDFKKEVEKELTGRETRTAGDYLFQAFKLYHSPMLVVEKAIETAPLMLGSDRSRGYCLEMICADFLAGANLDNGDPETLLFSMTILQTSFPKSSDKLSLLARASSHRECDEPRSAPLSPGSGIVRNSSAADPPRDSWRCQSCGTMSNLEVHHKQFRSHSGARTPKKT